jgi:hypothetical protein
MESEFVAATRGVQELLGSFELPKLAVPLHDQCLLCWTIKPLFAQIASEASSQRSKHIDIKYKFLKDLYLKQVIIPVHIPTKSMLADLLTKVLPTPEFRRLSSMIGLQDARKEEDTINDVDTRRDGVLE